MLSRSLSTFCLVVLTTLVVFIVLHQAKTVFAPVLSALLLGVILSPFSEFWQRLRIPAAFAAFLTVAIALLFILVLLVLVEPYATHVVNRTPIIMNEMRDTIESIKGTLRGIEQISEDMADAIDTNENRASGDPDAMVELPSVTDALFFAPQFAAQFMIFTGTLYFFLVVKSDIYRWVSLTSSRLMETDLREAGQQVSRYVLTITVINLGLGTVVAFVMHVLGMPSPVLWGLLAFGLNFVLYLGPIALIVMLTVTGIVVLDGAASFLPAAIYLALNATEAQFVTPTLVGKSLSVNPLLVFLSLVFWLWMWGPVGGIIAIPLLIWCATILQGLSGAQPKLQPESPDPERVPT